MRKNLDFIAYTPQWSSAWRFFIRGTTWNLSQVYDEIIYLTKKFFTISDEFFIPTKLYYPLSTKPYDCQIYQYFLLSKLNFESIDFFEKEIKSESGISFNDFHNDILTIKTQEQYIRYINRVDLWGKTCFSLGSNEVYINNNSPKELYAYWDYDEVDLDVSTTDPITISLIHSSWKGNNEVEIIDPAYYEIVIRSNTDIWFESSETGLINRNILRNFIKKLYQNFDIVDTSFFGDRYDEDELKEVVFGST